MELYSIGYNHIHLGDFHIDRPDGCGSWLLLIIRTPALFTVNGKEIAVKENSFVLYEPFYPHFYRILKDRYADDWMHFMLNEKETELLKKCNIPLNAPVFLGFTEEISSIIRNMTYEFYFESEFKQSVLDLYMSLLLIKMGQACAGNVQRANYESIYFEKMQFLRNDIYNMPKNVPSIDDMAKSLSMSRSYFQHTYKSIFGISVMNDVLNSRLCRAKQYLTSSNLTISSIAEESGFNSESYFIRQFKKAYGITPNVFRSHK